MARIFLQDLPFDLDTSCPIKVPWQASMEPEIPASWGLFVGDEAEEQHEVYNYMKRRYWETLYFPEVGTSLIGVTYISLTIGPFW